MQKQHFPVFCAIICSPFLCSENQFRYFKRERGEIMKGQIKKKKILCEVIAHSSQLPMPLHQKDTFNIWTFYVTLG